jgi:tetratricopeptide (TPR) repeat protein
MVGWKGLCEMSAHVFLSHSTADKPAVENLARRLAEEGIEAWLDKWNLIPGDPWQPAIEEALADSETCAVFIGPSALSPWQKEEMRVAINRRVRDSKNCFRVIPVLLPGAKRESLPAFLVNAMWVEFRGSIDDSDAFHCLVCGIRNVAPGPRGQDARGSLRTTHNLPFVPNPAFTGREAELERLGERLQKSGEVAVSQTVALHGLGGVGKTQLAIEYAWKHLGGYEAVLWVKAESPQTLDASLARIAGVLGLPESSAKEQGVQTDAVLGWLKGRDRWLLIADNADTNEAARALRDRLGPNLGGHVLVTSRLGRWPINIVHLPLEVLLPDDAAHYLQHRVAKEGQHAGDETAARRLAEELGFLPLALEQAAAFIIEVHWSFDKYCEHFSKARPELLSYEVEGATRYANSVAKTWSISLERLSPLSRALLRLTAWFATEAIPRRIFTADKAFLSKALGTMVAKGALGGTRGWTSYFGDFFWRLGQVDVSNLAVDQALAELARFSLVRLTSETVSVHRLLQAVEQDALTKVDSARWLEWAVRLFNAFAPESPDEIRTWSIWLALLPHAEALIKHTQSHGLNATPVGKLANLHAVFLYARADYMQAEPLYRRALAIDEASFGPVHPRVAIGLNNLAQLLKTTNRLSDAEPLIRRALAIDEASFGPVHPRVARDLNNLGQLLQATNRLSDAEPLYRRALVIDEASFGPDHPSVARDLNNLGQLLQTTNRLSEAEPLYRRALTISEASFGSVHPRVAIGLNNLAQLLQATNRLSEAEPLIRQALAIDEASFGPDHPNVAMDLNNLALLLKTTNRLSDAEPLYRRALAIDEASFGPDHPRVAMDLNNLAQLLQATSRLSDAEPLMRRALAIDEASFGPDHPNVAMDLNNLALLLKTTSRFSDAEPLIRRALAIDEKSYGPDHPNVAIELNNLAQLLQATNRLSDAEPLYRRALAIDEASFGPDHPNVAMDLNNLVALLQATSRLSDAEPLIRRALAIDEASFGPVHPRVAIELNNLAQLLQATNRLSDAEPLMRRALAIDEASFGPVHTNVAIGLHNLAALLQATNRLSDAEPLSRRALEIFFQFTADTSHEHPHMNAAIANYSMLLEEMGRSPAQIRAQLDGIVQSILRF